MYIPNYKDIDITDIFITIFKSRYKDTYIDKKRFNNRYSNIIYIYKYIITLLFLYVYF